MKYLTRLLLAGLAFVTPIVTVLACEDHDTPEPPAPPPPPTSNCTIREVPYVAQCSVNDQIVVFA